MDHTVTFHTRGMATKGLVPAALFALCLSNLVHAQTPTHVGTFIDPSLVMGSACGTDNCVGESIKYLQAIGVYEPGTTTPTADRGTSSAWKASHGFSADPTKPNPGELRAVYWNAGDLALGRDMHCITKDTTQNIGRFSRLLAQTYACYVTNFRVNTPVVANVFAGTPDIQTSISNAAQNTTALATVAMEVTFTPVFHGRLPPLGVKLPMAPSNVEFIAFDEQNGGIPFNPALDTEGPKAAPGNCMACHGGQYVSSQQSGGPHTQNSNFLPFNTNPTNFNYSNTLPQFSETSQREAFRKLNEFVLATQPAAPTIADLISGWYEWCGGINTAGCYIEDAGNAFLPDLPTGGALCGASLTDEQTQTCGWRTGVPVDSTQKPASLTHNVYQKVAAPYCRGCHVAAPGVANVEQFNNWRGLSINGQQPTPPAQSVVTLHLMPDAEQPFKKYWSDSNAQNLFNEFFSNLPSACVASCNTGANTCSNGCNVAEGQCFQGAHNGPDRGECAREKLSCSNACGHALPACINACPF
jgi:mono/diheme cytochrome c family protein